MALIDVGGQRGNPTLSDWFERWHIDSWTLSLLLILSGFGMVMLYSASGHDLGAVSAQAKRLGLGFVLMILVARASSSRASPAGVSSTPRGNRRNSAAPRCCSSALICCDNGGCAMPSCRAARVICRASATATK